MLVFYCVHAYFNAKEKRKEGRGKKDSFSTHVGLHVQGLGVDLDLRVIHPCFRHIMKKKKTCLISQA